MSERVVGLDTSILILHANDDPLFGNRVEAVLAGITSGSQRGLLSVVGITEFLSVRPAAPQTRDRQERGLQRLLRWVTHIPYLEIVDVDTRIAVAAARLRQFYGFKTPDSLHLATAIASGADVFVTGDKQLKKCREIRVHVL